MGKPKVSDMPVPSPEDFEDRHDPRMFVRATELNVGESVTALFLGIEEYSYHGKRCFNMMLKDQSEKIIKLPISTRLRYISALCVPEKTWVRITRDEDSEKQGRKAPMKNFRYQTAGPIHTDSELSEIIRANEWDFKRRSVSRLPKD